MIVTVDSDDDVTMSMYDASACISPKAILTSKTRSGELPSNIKKSERNFVYIS